MSTSLLSTKAFFQKWMRTALLFLFIASLLGTLMRYFYLQEIPFLQYKRILYAHFHVALLGWGYMLLSGAILFLFCKQKSKYTYQGLYLLNVVAALGMGTAFLFLGKGAVSYGFLGLFVLSSYLFSWLFFKDGSVKDKPYYPFLQWGMYWLLFSSLGLWSMAGMGLFATRNPILYYASVQFFLHFQLNGWLSCSVLGLLYFFFGKSPAALRIKRIWFWTWQASILLTYALSIAWSTPLSIVFYLNALGVLLQVVAFYHLLSPLLLPLLRRRQPFVWVDYLLVGGLLGFAAKVLIQSMLIVPAVAVISYTIRNYVIGFLHLIVLGAITLSTVAVLIKEELLWKDTYAKYGWMLFAIGFLGTEGMLFFQGTCLWLRLGFIPQYHLIIFLLTLSFPLALFVILAKNR